MSVTVHSVTSDVAQNSAATQLELALDNSKCLVALDNSGGADYGSGECEVDCDAVASHKHVCDKEPTTDMTVTMWLRRSRALLLMGSCVA